MQTLQGGTARGFTLLELMIAVAIVGVLAAVAIPMYRTQMIQSRAAGMLDYAQIYKKDIETYLAEHEALPATVDSVVAPTSMINKTLFDFPAAGVVHIRLYPTQALASDVQVGKQYVTIQGVASGTTITWDCGAIGAGFDLPSNYMPGW